MLENFRPYNVNIGMPYVSFTTNGITFNKTTVVRMGKPEYVVLYINDEEKQIAIKKTDANDENATAFFKPKKNDVVSARWGSKELLHKIYNMMQWDVKKDSFKVNGVYYSEEEVMIFDLNNVERL